MEQAKQCGGPAFPAPDLGEQDFNQRAAYPGMTLRDYFAAKALGGLVVNGDNFNAPKLAAYCYQLADEMVAARGAA